MTSLFLMFTLHKLSIRIHRYISLNLSPRGGAPRPSISLNHISPSCFTPRSLLRPQQETQSRKLVPLASHWIGSWAPSSGALCHFPRLFRSDPFETPPPITLISYVILYLSFACHPRSRVILTLVSVACQLLCDCVIVKLCNYKVLSRRSHSILSPSAREVRN